MNAKDLMSTNVECISPQTALIEAAQKMKSLDIGFLAVCENDRIVGALTDRDIVVRAVAAGKDLHQYTARDVMTTDVFWSFEDQTADEVAEYMAEREIRRVLILDRKKRLAGVISIGDLAKAHGKKAGETMRDIAQAPSQAA